MTLSDIAGLILAAVILAIGIPWVLEAATDAD